MTLQQLRSLGLLSGDRVRVICQTSDTKRIFLEDPCPTTGRTGYFIDNESVIRRNTYEQVGIVAGTEEYTVESAKKQGEFITFEWLEIGKMGQRLHSDRKIERNEEGLPILVEGVNTMRIPVSAIVDVLLQDSQSGIYKSLLPIGGFY